MCVTGPVYGNPTYKKVSNVESVFMISRFICRLVRKKQDLRRGQVINEHKNICVQIYQINMSFYRYRNHHYKDKSDSRPSYLYNENPIPGKTNFVMKCGSVSLVTQVLMSHHAYRKTSSTSRTKSPNLNVSCIPLQLSSLNPLKPGVKLRMKM